MRGKCLLLVIAAAMTTLYASFGANENVVKILDTYDQLSRFTGKDGIYIVKDAATTHGDPTVKYGWAAYVYDTTINGFRLISKKEALDNSNLDISKYLTKALYTQDITRITSIVDNSATVVDECQTKVTTALTNVNELANRVSTTLNQISSIDSRLSDAENNLATTISRVDTTESNLSTTDGRVTSIDGRITAAENNLSAAVNRVGVVENNLAAVTARVGATESNLSGVLTRVSDAESNLATTIGRVDTVESSKLDKLSNGVEGKIVVCGGSNNIVPSEYSPAELLSDYYKISEIEFRYPNRTEVTTEIGSAIAPTNPTFSNAVLAVGMNIDTNSVAVLNEILSDSGSQVSIGEMSTTVGSIILALVAAVAWLKRKVNTLPESILAGETMSSSPSQEELEAVVKKIFTAIGGTIVEPPAPAYTLNTDGTVSTEGELNEDGTLTVEGDANPDGTFTVETV